MKLFEPFLKDVPLSYAYERPQFYRNAAREEKWGTPVYFAPSTWEFDVNGSPGPYYSYGHNATEKLGKYNNCTWFCLCRHHENSGEILTALIDHACNVFDNYKGRKEGSLLSQIYIGDKVQQGDMLVWADDLDGNGSGHVNYIEKVDDEKVYISEGGYSKKPCYKDKTCITYTLNKADLITSTRLSLRPVAPYSEYLIGVIHTGDCYDKVEPVPRDDSVDQIKVNNSYINIRTEPSTSSSKVGYFKQGYYNVDEIKEQSDYTWYRIGQYWCAGVEQVDYLPKVQVNYKELYEIAQNKLDRIKEIINE